MFQSQLFGKTLKELPEEVQVVSHKFLLRGGFIRQIAAGLYSYLPLGFRVLEKIKKIIYKELSKKGVQHLLMPVLHPAELWQESGRWDELDEIMYKLKNNQNRDLCLAVTHEETISHLTRHEFSSYRQLPVILNHIQLKFRDELRPRGGLLRMREFTMQDAYSFDKNEEDLQQSYEKITSAYEAIFRRCGLNTIIVDADSGKMGGKFSHEFMILADSGEDLVITCVNCDYKANREKAILFKEIKNPDEKPKPISEIRVSVERGITVKANSAYHNVEPWQILKTMIYKGDEKEYVAVAIRGDLEINETKVANNLPYKTLRLVTAEELNQLDSVQGFVSPINLKPEIKIIADESVQTVNNFIASPNKKDFDLLNINYPRDFEVEKIADLASAEPGNICGFCKKGFLKATRGVEVAHTFKLGTRYSKPMNLKYTDEKGNEQLILMGCYGIGVDRILAGAVEQWHDENGIIWPENIAPFKIHFLGLDLEDEKIKKEAQSVYEKLHKEYEDEILFDDRNEKAGVKFKDADLLGIPWRLVISKRSLSNGGLEIKKRNEKEGAVVPIAEITHFFKNAES